MAGDGRRPVLPPLEEIPLPPGPGHQGGNGHRGNGQRAGEWTPRGPAVAVYPYRDEARELLFEVLRTAGGELAPRVPDPARASGHRWTFGAVRRVLYRLPEVIDAVADGEPVFVTGTEHAADAIVAAGSQATSCPGGAGRWRGEYAEVLRDAVVFIIADRTAAGRAHARQVMASLQDIAAAAEIFEPVTGTTAADHLAAGKSLAELECTVRAEDYAPDLAQDLYEFLAEGDPPDQWLIEQILERGDKIIFTGREGLGKTHVVRQMVTGAAAGIHPFTGALCPPVRVLVIDCENSRKKSRRKYREMERIARAKGRPVPDGGLRIIHRPEGINLADDTDRAWLMERVQAHRCDILAIGPLWKLHLSDINEELAAHQITNALDAVIARHDCALIIEAHPPKGTDKIEPRGSGVFLGWPDSGRGIRVGGRCPVHGCTDDHAVLVLPWRGDREERHWPSRLVWGTEPDDWPWVIPPPPPPPPPPEQQGLISVEEAQAAAEAHADELAARRAKAAKGGNKPGPKGGSPRNRLLIASPVTGWRPQIMTDPPDPAAERPGQPSRTPPGRTPGGRPHDPAGCRRQGDALPRTRPLVHREVLGPAGTRPDGGLVWELACPACGDLGIEQAPGDHAAVTAYPDRGEYDSPIGTRGGYVRIQLACQSGQHRFDLIIAGHKGLEFIGLVPGAGQ